MTPKPHITRHRLIGEARIKHTVLSAWIIWNVPTPVLSFNNHGVGIGAFTRSVIR